MKLKGHDVRLITDSIIYVEESRTGEPIAYDPDRIVRGLKSLIGGLGSRRIFYRDIYGVVDEIVCHQHGFYHFRSAPLEIQIKIAEILGRKK